MSNDYRKAAKGQECTLRVASYFGLPCASTETTVLCHARIKRQGKMGGKVEDWWSGFGCATCHQIMDGPANLIDYIIELDAILHKLKDDIRWHRQNENMTEDDLLDPYFALIRKAYIEEKSGRNKAEAWLRGIYETQKICRALLEKE